MPRLVPVAFALVLLVGTLMPSFTEEARADMFHHVRALPFTRELPGSIVVGDSLWVFGGFEGTATHGHTWRHDLVTGETEQLPGVFPQETNPRVGATTSDCCTTAHERGNIGTATDGRYIWLFGGQYLNDNVWDGMAYRGIVRFDTLTRTSLSIEDAFPFELMGLSAAYDGRYVVVAGGHTVDSQYSFYPASAAVWRYDPLDHSVVRFPQDLPQGRTTPVVQVDGRTLVLSGDQVLVADAETLSLAVRHTGSRTPAISTRAGVHGDEVLVAGDAWTASSPWVLDDATGVVTEAESDIDVVNSVWWSEQDGGWMLERPGRLERLDLVSPPLPPLWRHSYAPWAVYGEIEIAWENHPHWHPTDGYRVLRGDAPEGPFAVVGTVAHISYPYQRYVLRDTGLEHGRAYVYMIESHHGDATARTDPVEIRTNGAPSPVVGLAARTGAEPGAIELDWSQWYVPDDGQHWVRIERATGEGPFAAVTTLAPSVLSHVDRGLADATLYRYQVFRVNPAGDSSPAFANATTRGLPTAPRELSVTTGPERAGQLTLAWSEPADPGASSITSYDVHHVEADGTLTWLARTTVRTHADEGRAAGTSHTYRVVANNAVGASVPSEPATGIAPVAPTAPRSPSAAPGPGAGEIRLEWTAPLSTGGIPVAAYRVYRVAGDGSLSLASEATGRAFVDAGVAAGEARSYRVAAVNEVGEGPLSSLVSASAPLPPGQPIMRGTDYNLQGGWQRFAIRVDWDAGPTGGLTPWYRVERSIDGSPFAQHALTPATEYLDRQCPIARECSYRVVAYHAAGESAPSLTASARGLPMSPIS